MRYPTGETPHLVASDAEAVSQTGINVPTLRVAILTRWLMRKTWPLDSNSWKDEELRQ